VPLVRHPTLPQGRRRRTRRERKLLRCTARKARRDGTFSRYRGKVNKIPSLDDSGNPIIQPEPVSGCVASDSDWSDEDSDEEFLESDFSSSDSDSGLIPDIVGEKPVSHPAPRKMGRSILKIGKDAWASLPKSVRGVTIPHWWIWSFGLSPCLFRKAAKKLTSWERMATLAIRMSYLITHCPALSGCSSVESSDSTLFWCIKQPGRRSFTETAVYSLLRTSSRRIRRFTCVG